MLFKQISSGEVNMSVGINRVILIGYLTKDPVMKKAANETVIANFTCAVNRRYQNQDQQADFPNCVAFNKTADFIGTYGKKGNLISIEGRIQTRNYDDATGKRVYVTEVVCDSVQLLESKPKENTNEYIEDPVYEEAPLEIDSDSLPF